MILGAEKFMFDRSFDPPRAIEPEVEEEEVEEEEAEEAELEAPPPPMFSQDELEAAKTQAFTQGEQKGRQEAAQTTEQHAANALTALAGKIAELFEMQKESAKIANRDACAVAATMTRKAFPHFVRQQGTAEIEAMIREAMPAILDEPRMIVHVHESITEYLGPRIEQLAHGRGYEGRVVVLSDPHVAEGDCRVEWAEGGAERTSRVLWKQLDEIVARNLGIDALPDVDDTLPETDEDALPLPENVQATKAPTTPEATTPSEPEPEPVLEPVSQPESSISETSVEVSAEPLTEITEPASDSEPEPSVDEVRIDPDSGAEMLGRVPQKPVSLNGHRDAEPASEDTQGELAESIEESAASLSNDDDETKPETP